MKQDGYCRILPQIVIQVDHEPITPPLSETVQVGRHHACSHDNRECRRTETSQISHNMPKTLKIWAFQKRLRLAANHTPPRADQSVTGDRRPQLPMPTHHMLAQPAGCVVHAVIPSGPERFVQTNSTSELWAAQSLPPSSLANLARQQQAARR
jgi:hypothetical protein